MRAFIAKLKTLLLLSYVLTCVLAFATPAMASPFGQGVFGANVPFGSATSLSVALSGNVTLNLTPSGSNFTATGSHTVTVTSTDVVGYALYAYTPTSSSMTNGANSIPASSNGTPGALAVNTWGYNTDGSSNYLGMTTTPTQILTASGPYETGNATTVTYGVLVDITKPAGTYSASVVYVAACLSQ